VVIGAATGIKRAPSFARCAGEGAPPLGMAMTALGFLSEIGRSVPGLCGGGHAASIWRDASPKRFSTRTSSYGLKQTWNRIFPATAYRFEGSRVHSFGAWIPLENGLKRDVVCREHPWAPVCDPHKDPLLRLSTDLDFQTLSGPRQSRVVILNNGADTTRSSPWRVETIEDLDG
jgi:hypothetical protein